MGPVASNDLGKGSCSAALQLPTPVQQHYVVKPVPCQLHQAAEAAQASVKVVQVVAWVITVL